MTYMKDRQQALHSVQVVAPAREGVELPTAFLAGGV